MKSSGLARNTCKQCYLTLKGQCGGGWVAFSTASGSGRNSVYIHRMTFEWWSKPGSGWELGVGSSKHFETLLYVIFGDLLKRLLLPEGASVLLFCLRWHVWKWWGGGHRTPPLLRGTNVSSTNCHALNAEMRLIFWHNYRGRHLKKEGPRKAGRPLAADNWALARHINERLLVYGSASLLFSKVLNS